MPQLMALLLVGASAYVGYRTVKERIERSRQRRSDAESKAGRAGEAPEQPAARKGEPKDLGALELDPATGVYRPRSN